MDKQQLIDRIRRQRKPLDASAPGLEARPPSLNDIRAVVFDVYGTLLISKAGNISHGSSDERNQAIIDSLQAINVGIRLAEAPFGDLFSQLVLQGEESRRADHIEFPEIDILQVWKYLLIEAVESGWIDRYPSEAERQLLAIEFECRINPVAPMPGLLETFSHLSDRGIVLALVSNAQFFTPLLFPALLEQDLDQLGFDSSCNVWSWKLREAKPSRRLFLLLAEKLKQNHGIDPAEALVIGNDMRNDIAPAAACGFRTALFAGDNRSLHLRKDDPLVGEIKPDGVLTSLKQLIH